MLLQRYPPRPRRRNAGLLATHTQLGQEVGQSPYRGAPPDAQQALEHNRPVTSFLMQEQDGYPWMVREEIKHAADGNFQDFHFGQGG
ncbi:hypothetical protein AOX55_00005948 (plasmid) [Sinorhizobium fredii CCBAU 25509]|nr:hypothetical protein AOX55_00005948 [Sinorhizobium fredii CCBAU 25509]